jgi:hypothetical protein
VMFAANDPAERCSTWDARERRVAPLKKWRRFTMVEAPGLDLRVWRQS